MGSTPHSIYQWVCSSLPYVGHTSGNKQWETNLIWISLNVRLLHRKVCYLLSWLNRRVRNRTHGGVRGRGFYQNPFLLDWIVMQRKQMLLAFAGISECWSCICDVILDTDGLSADFRWYIRFVGVDTYIYCIRVIKYHLPERIFDDTWRVIF